MLSYNKYHIFITKRDINIDLTNYNHFSNYRINKIKQSSSKLDKALNIQTEKLLFYGLKHIIKDIDTYPEIITNDQGKPYFKDIDLAFNITHSHNYIVVAIGKKDVGIDIEKIDPKRMKIASKIFNQDELSKLKNNLDHLIQTWTIKEAYIKLYGLSVLIDLKQIIIKDNLINSKYGKAYYKTHKIDNYYLSIVSKNKPNIAIHNVIDC